LPAPGKGSKECKSITKISHLQRATRVEIIKHTLQILSIKQNNAFRTNGVIFYPIIPLWKWLLNE
ncbi:hypothetical protein, partial [Butyricimonas sp.]|uniref:hypothetical protein n=1 Tax=Butyricimonas sp. TaxID=1969738 RepID=UPI001B0D38EE